MHRLAPGVRAGRLFVVMIGVKTMGFAQVVMAISPPLSEMQAAAGIHNGRDSLIEQYHTDQYLNDDGQSPRVPTLHCSVNN